MAFAFFIVHIPYAHADQSAKSVCEYVANLANQGKESSIFLDRNAGITPKPVNLLGDGTKYYVYSGQWGGFHSPYIAALRTPLPTDYSPAGDLNSNVNFDPLNFQSMVDGSPQGSPDAGDEVHLFLYNNKYYVVHDSTSPINMAENGLELFPVAVVAPNRGIICNIAHHIKPKLATDLDPSLCQEFLAGKAFRNVDMDSPDDAIQKGFVMDEAEPTGVADIDLQNNKKIVTIVSYSLSSSRDTGCDNNGIVLYDRSKNKIDQSGLEDQLHSIPSDCVGAAVYPITVNGKIYIESDHGNENNNIMRGEAKGIGIYTFRDDHLTTICAVENHMVFTAQ